jgi:hypothetical protein
MIEGYFGNKGELYFEIDLIAADNSVITVNALLVQRGRNNPPVQVASG